MAETAAARPAKPGPFTPLISILSGLIVATFMAIVLGCAIHWAGLAWFWPQEGAGRARSLLEADLAALKPFTRSALPGVRDPLLLAQSSALLVSEYSGMTRVLGAVAAAPQAAEQAQGKGPLSVSFRGLLAGMGPALAATYYLLQDIAVRLVIAFLALPVLGVALCVTFTDGLARRDVRRWCGGRESSFIYHNSKRYLWPLATLAFTVYLAWPLPGLAPVTAVLIGYVLMACVIGLMAAKFKKYL